MVCVYCSSDTRVINSRKQLRTGGVWRRRQCQQCQAIITSQEMVDLSSSVTVRNSQGALEPFLRDKLFISLHDSLKHRKTAIRDATLLTDTVWTSLVPHIKTALIDISEVKDCCYSVLHKFDPAAASYYTAYHLS